MEEIAVEGSGYAARSLPGTIRRERLGSGPWVFGSRSAGGAGRCGPR